MSAARRAIRGLYAVTRDDRDTEALIARVRAAIAGGARFIQYRNKTATPDLKLEQARALKSLCEDAEVPLIINDDVELALAVGAHGVHLGAGDDSPEEARQKLGPDNLIGVSCYNRLELALEAEARGADYVAFGSFFPSHVKPGAVHAPLDLLVRAKRELDIPVAAIGGITLENAPRLLAAGADALAVISALFTAPDVTLAALRFAELFEAERL